MTAMLLELHNPEEFTDEQICARCGFPGSHHRPGKSYSYAKTGSSSGKSHEVPITARTCNFTDTLTTCVAFSKESE